MEGGTQATSTSNRRVKRSKSLMIFLWLVIGALVVAAIIFAKTGGVGANNANCVAPEGYESIAGVMATSPDGHEYYIGRAIINTGDGSSAGKAVNIPACVSKDPALEPFGGEFATLRDGRVVFIASGLKGVIVPLPQPPQP